MDKVDMKLLAAMEENSRISLKNLARDLNVKTSTIYHRLHKLKESNILENFTIIINPEAVGLNKHIIMNIRLKKMVIGKLDTMFLESFGKFLAEQYEEVLFSSVGSDEMIWIIATFRDDKHYEQFKSEISENPYIENSETVLLNSILKGQKIFKFLPNLLKQEAKGDYFSEDDEDEKPDANKKSNSSEDDETDIFF
ncbi:Lrp/AsnC family transcriptional regulator [Promethearchaeum syntrophicum]|uniref:Lrp/AsnC family transcriptional regulator n=1 Tax=Promethearchaeum syntrophicum TaxID=2594042 RepID=A0A5B9D9D0_9ARCH|nr:Lrp/AsnC family transcriptional regulator [Candidatus Prometheoarchaeum syntrophicum]